jgi:hypothetical protein
VGKRLNAKDIHKEIKKYNVENLTIPNNALESVWKGAIMAKFKVSFRRGMNNHSRDSLCPGRDHNKILSAENSEALPLASVFVSSVNSSFRRGISWSA